MSRINILVKSAYLAEQSRPAAKQYVYSYTIRIENQGDDSVQLLARRWLITDANGETQEVKGLGVVGEQPHIGAGESYMYSSGAVLNTPVGTMEGEYELVGSDGAHFFAPIPLFTLAQPSALH